MSAALPAGIARIALGRVASSNDAAKRLAEAGAVEGTLVTAEEQTAGRGRRGRSWSSPPGNLYLSLLLRPKLAMQRLPELGFLAAVALTDVLAPLLPGRTLAHKWPNDVLLDGAKLAGILVETAGGTGGVWAVVGCGVNVESHPETADRPATSLRAAGVATSPEALLAPVVAALVAWRDRWLAEGFAPVRAAWLARAGGLGAAISLRGPRGAEMGTFAGLDAGGALLLAQADGVRRVALGEVMGSLA